MKYSDLKQDTPRLVIMFQRGPNGEEGFQWGMEPPQGAIPLLTLIGAIIRVQARIGRPEVRLDAAGARDRVGRKEVRLVRVPVHPSGPTLGDAGDDKVHYRGL